MDNKNNEQPKERCVVFLADAIVKKNAVMVESVDASVTSTTVVTGLGHLGLATLAGDQPGSRGNLVAQRTEPQESAYMSTAAPHSLIGG